MVDDAGGEGEVRAKSLHAGMRWPSGLLLCSTHVTPAQEKRGLAAVEQSAFDSRRVPPFRPTSTIGTF